MQSIGEMVSLCIGGCARSGKFAIILAGEVMWGAWKPVLASRVHQYRELLGEIGVRPPANETGFYRNPKIWAFGHPPEELPGYEGGF